MTVAAPPAAGIHMRSAWVDDGSANPSSSLSNRSARDARANISFVPSGVNASFS